MKYRNISKGRFISRPNRFIAYVEIDGVEETVHVKNTGRCRELLLPGAEVSLEQSENTNRKTKWDLIAVVKPSLGWVNIDSQVPNKVVMEWLQKRPEPFQNVTLIKPEYSYGESRIDFYMEAPGRRILLEVKGCTLEQGGVGYFPDAPTERGAKHLRELAGAVKEGYETYILYCIAMEGISTVLPNGMTDPAYTEAYKQAGEQGVHTICLQCKVSDASIEALQAVFAG